MVDQETPEIASGPQTDVCAAPPLTGAKLAEHEWREERRRLVISRARAAVVRKEVAEAYEILERIRFDHLGDTAFREKWVRAKRGCEEMLADFLLSDFYWSERLYKHGEKVMANPPNDQGE